LRSSKIAAPPPMSSVAHANAPKWWYGCTERSQPNTTIAPIPISTSPMT
jgi:hypothetical protein